ncbi:hypothetical protein D0866_07363 [Hortaea werneckii]|uniref:Fucose-specific lectin n=1 Tax=Hortaea werneckii TaxID=91943 RepID=A0A3M7AV58_HORWE|nr:hypothetical protein D0866_07363 [Hortaea werneckii]
MTDRNQSNSSPPYERYFPYPEIPNAPQYGTDGGARGFEDKLPGKDRPLSPELASPGLESVWAHESEKEVAAPPQLPRPNRRAEEIPPRRRLCGLPERSFYLLLAAVIATAIALGVGLGVGLGSKHERSSSASASVLPAPTSTQPALSPTATENAEYLIGGALDPSYYSTTGAFNGSGIALASQSFATDLQTGTQGSIVMYFQHHSGEIRWQQLSSSGWIGGSASEVVAVDAKNSTPLSAVAYTTNGTSTWHIFYIDQNNLIKQRSNSNTTNVWVDGPINTANLKANDANQVGMQACWYGNDYGDSDYTHTPLPDSGGDEDYDEDVGMHLWYAVTNSSFEQWGWRDGEKEWRKQALWDRYNGHAGIGCYSWGPGTTTYVMLVNLQNTVEFWWKDTNTNVTGNDTHPINKWTNATQLAINDVYPATSLGYTNYFYAQSASDRMIRGYNISWAAENTTILQGEVNQFTVEGEPGLPGTHLSVTAIPNYSGGNELLVFYQTNGTDISEYTRDFYGGQWARVDIEIPESDD